MTREQAHHKLMAETRNYCTPSQMDDFIDMSVALGMLKLDEPKTIEYRAIEALADGRDGIAMSSHGAFACIKKLEAAGLKIVEK